MTRRALVTGGAGFIGSHVADQLLAAASNGRGLAVVDALRYLFALGDEPAAPDADQKPADEER